MRAPSTQTLTVVEDPWRVPSHRHRSLSLNLRAAPAPDYLHVPSYIPPPRSGFPGWKRTAGGLDSEIQQLKANIIELEHRRNAVVPVACLPAELLLKIFTLCLPSVDELGSYWYGFSQVCHFWRRVALRSPSLWGHIDCTRPKSMVTAMLARSATTPLALLADLSGRKPHQTELDSMLLAMQDRTRMQELKLILPYTAFDDKLMTHLTTAAPVLESCHINVTSTYGAHFPMSHLFANTTPRLHHLHLGGCSTEWNSPLFSGLRSLHLCTIPRDSQPLWSELFNLLSRNPYLEDLSFECALDRIPPDAHFDHEPLELPHLRSLSFRDAWDHCTTVLRHLRLPASTQFVARPFHNWRVETGSCFCAELAAHWARHSIKRHSLGRLHWRDHGNAFELQGWATETLGATPPLVSLWVIKPCSPADFDASAFVEAFGGAFSGVRTLGVQCEDDFAKTGGTDWVHAISSLRDVETVVVWQSTLPGLSAALLEDVADPAIVPSQNMRPGNSIHFPHLRAILLVGIQFSHGGSGVDGTFLRALRHRSDCGVPVESVLFGPGTFCLREQSDAFAEYVRSGLGYVDKASFIH